MNSEVRDGARGLMSWVLLTQRYALAIVLFALIAGAGLATFTVRNLSVDTDNRNMLSPELQWRKAEAELDRLFPKGSSGLVAVIDGDTPERAADAQRRLVAGLRAQPAIFGEVTALETEPYFQRNGLLFLGEDELQQLADQLTQAQPFLGTLQQDPSLHGLFTLLQRAVTQPAGADFDLSLALGKIAQGVDAATDARAAPLSWQGLIGAPQRANAQRRFVQIDVPRDFSQLLPAQKPIEAVRALAQQLGLDEAHGLRLRLTGTIALEHEELEVAFTGMGLAFGVAMLMAMALLYLALRSVRLMIAAVVTLVYGLLATAAFATLAVGHLNLISVAFGMLYVGLGLDYALYLCMQYRELLGRGEPHPLARAAADVGGFMTVCALTTSLGFFAFVPTPFTGIAELGIISGAGMFISLALSLTLLPALITLMPPDASRVRLSPLDSGWLGRVLEWPYAHARAIWIGSALLAVGALLLAPRAYFDYDPINLRDPKAESVSTFRDLLRDPSIPTLTLSTVAPDAASAQALAQRLRALPLVAQAMSLTDFVPRDQDAKLPILEDLSFNLGPALSSEGAVEVREHPQDRAALDALRTALPAYAAQQEAPRAESAQVLAHALERFDGALAAAAPDAQARLLQQLRENLLSSMPAQLAALKTSLLAAPVTEADLPPTLVERWVSADGHYRVEIWPKEQLDTPAAIERFVAQVRDAEPAAAGGPRGMLEAGHAVVAAFQQAFIYSFVAITLLLLVLLRSVGDTLLVLIPLTLAGLLTVAGSVLLNIPFNFANVIALPLILGVGVDYGVYLVQRGRRPESQGINLLQTSTARAVMFGALITMANFGNLALAKHPGMVSMGLLLTLGLGMTLLCALVLLPSLLARRPAR